MAPQRVARKRKSTASTAASTSSGPGLDNFPVPPQLVATKSGRTPSRTPIRSPAKRRVVITAAQKQALIDNLQLEITERARKLRAQYALQAQSLRTRLEIRIHRIPAALRKTNLAELLGKHAQKQEVKSQQKAIGPPRERSVSPTAYKSPAKSEISVKHRTVIRDQSNTQNTQPKQKRKSNEMISDDKENSSIHPAKRSRAAPAQTGPQPMRGPASRRVGPSREVLSPKSNNSRNLPPSPVKAPGGFSPYKSNMPRPVSPLKPVPAAVVAPTASSIAKTADKPKARPAAAHAASRAAPRASTVRGKRAVEEASGRLSSASDRTNTSAGTTIVKKAPRSAVTAPTASAAAKAKKPAAAAKARVKGTMTAAEKKAMVGTAGGASLGTGRGGRTLRKRT